MTKLRFFVIGVCIVIEALLILSVINIATVLLNTSSAVANWLAFVLAIAGICLCWLVFDLFLFVYKQLSRRN